MALPAVLAGGIATAIVAGLASAAGQIVLKVLFGLGIGYLTFTGVDLLVTQNEAQVLGLLGGLDPVAVQLIGVLKIGSCVKVIFSALVIRLSIIGLDQGLIKRMQVVS